jgi:hypothetical protein
MEPFFVKFAETVGARWRFEKVNVDEFVKKFAGDGRANTEIIHLKIKAFL